MFERIAIPEIPIEELVTPETMRPQIRQMANLAGDAGFQAFMSSR
jgi:hypothetical protein